MKSLYLLFLVSFFVLSGCLNEDNADPAKPATYVRYYSGGNPTEANDMLKTPDGGFIILSTVTLTGGDEGITEFSRIKLIKTDAYGNVEWQQRYPDDLTTETVSWTASGLSARAGGGYIIAGEDIQSSGTRFLIVVVGSEGQLQSNGLIDFENDRGNDVSGLAVTEKNGVFFVLGRIDTPINNMIVGSVNPSNLTETTWDLAYGAGDASLVNRLFVDDGNNIVWGGTVDLDNDQKMRLVRTQPNSLVTEFDLFYGSPDYDEAANGICRLGNGYALIGNSSEEGNDDMVMKRLAEDGTELSSFTFFPPDTQQDEEGNAIASTRDGGLILLGTFPSTTELGRGGDDFYLVKIDPFGTLQWSRIFGSKDDDQAVAVLQTDDGGYVVLGTTEFANVNTVSLVKVDKEGNIN